LFKVSYFSSKIIKQVDKFNNRFRTIMKENLLAIQYRNVHFVLIKRNNKYYELLKYNFWKPTFEIYDYKFKIVKWKYIVSNYSCNTI